MSTVPINNRSVSFVLNRSSDGVFKIDADETRRRTKWMIANDKNMMFSQISVRLHLEEDLDYDREEKMDLKALIENVYFKEVSSNADVNDLVEATTVGDLSARIFDKYIPVRHRV